MLRLKVLKKKSHLICHAVNKSEETNPKTARGFWIVHFKRYNQKENKMENTDLQPTPEKRNILLRIVFSLLWLFPIIILVNMIFGGIVGGMAGTETLTYDEGYVAGQKASEIFFKNYGSYLFVAEIIIWATLSALGKLPGTAKFKKIKL